MVTRFLYDWILYGARGNKDFSYKDSIVEGVPAQNVYFRNLNGALLHGQFFQKPHTDLVTIMNHGQGGNLSMIYGCATLMIACNTSVFVYDYQGFGHSGGKPNLNTYCGDGVAAYDYVRDALHYKANQIIEFGGSMGTGIACNVAKQHPCAGVVLFAPYSSLLKVARHSFWYLNLYPDSLFPYKDIETLSFVRKLHPPILMFHNSGDQVIPADQARELAACAKTPLTFVEYNDDGHCRFFGEHTSQTLGIIKTFVEDLEKKFENAVPAPAR
jgi:pimeloyl-ACP methyl ester carboxylesterase